MENDTDKSPEDNSDKRCDMLDAHAKMLAKHFDTVEVICTRLNNKNGSDIYECGKGNWFARAGSLREWLTREDEKSRKMMRDQE